MAVTETGHLASREVDDLYRRHGAEVYRYAYAVLGNHADAEDVTQTTFLNAYRSLEQGVRPRKPANWLLTIASNAIKQRFRQEQARPRQVELDEQIAGHEVDDDDSPSVGELLTALSKIPPHQRQAIVLREFEGRSYAEIASILGVTTGALETLLFRARRSLAEELEHQLTCTDAQLAVSKAADGRLGRKERRRLKDHLAECPDCAHFARIQQRHRSALRGLMLLPIPLSLTLFKGLEGAGTASAATLHLVPAAGSATGAGTTTATSAGVGVGAGAASSGGFVAGGAAIKAAAAIVAVTVASGAAVTTAVEMTQNAETKAPTALTTPGKRLGKTAPRGVSVPGNGIARGKLTAPGALKKAAAMSHGPKLKTRGSHSSVAPGHATTHGRTGAPGHTTTPEQTTTEQTTTEQTTTEQTAAPQQTTTSTPTSKTKAKGKSGTKAKRIAAAKRANTTKQTSAQPPVGSGNNNGDTGTGSGGDKAPGSEKSGGPKP